MITRLRDKLTYANVTATAALFVALGGTSYAALKLPRNSVGKDQIRAGAVRSSEIRNGSVRSADLSSATRRALIGAAGPQGQPGPAGSPAPRYFAAVSAAGELTRGNASSATHSVAGSGAYSVGFGQSASACAYSATVGNSDSATAPAGRITVRDDGGRVGIQTYDPAGNPTDLAFHLIVDC